MLSFQVNSSVGYELVPDCNKAVHIDRYKVLYVYLHRQVYSTVNHYAFLL